MEVFGGVQYIVQKHSGNGSGFLNCVALEVTLHFYR